MMNHPAAGRLIILGSQLARKAGLDSHVASLGYEVVAVLDDPAEVMLHASVSDLALVDLHLGGEAGGEHVSRRLRSECDLPAVMVTHRDDSGLAALSARSSSFGCVQLPFHARELQAVLQRAMIRQQVEIERRRFERQQLQTQKIEGLGIMGGRLVHDFNNILQGILGHVELAARSLPEKSPLQVYLDQAVQSGMRGAGLCRAFHLYSQPPAGKPALSSLTELVLESQALLRTVVKKGVRLDYDLAPGLPLLAIDPAYARQLIFTLAIDASESIGARRGTLRIRTCNRWLRAGELARMQRAPGVEEGEFVSLEFSHECARVAAPADDGRALAAIHTLGQLHGGAIEHLEPEDGGTTLRVNLPVPFLRREA